MLPSFFILVMSVFFFPLQVFSFKNKESTTTQTTVNVIWSYTDSTNTKSNVGTTNTNDDFEFEEEDNNLEMTTPYNKDNLYPPRSHKEGPMPIISDSLYSLIILIYVSVIFIFMFFSFCWKPPPPPPPDPAHKNIPMITSILEEMERQEQEEAAARLAAESDSLETGNACNGMSSISVEECHEMQQQKPLMNPEKILVNVINEKPILTSPLKQPVIHEEDEEEDEEESATQV